MTGEQRRLAAVVSADVVGYSRLMGRDERGTLATLKAHRAELFDPAIAEHGGRIVKTTGDGLLLEFASVVAAVECALAFQDGMARRNAGVGDDDVMRFRVGIHLGDLIPDGDDILGDGVNVAARLQEIGDPGGITISGVVHDYLDEGLAARFDDDGERELKNIRRPIGVWRWLPRHQSTGDAEQVIAPALPDRPSIAVLPFVAMSEARQHEFIADGLAEDLTTLLARVPGFLVIAQNSAFSYRGRALDVRQIGRELGVRYVVEGSLRPMGPKLRVGVQLSDAQSGKQLWADRFDVDEQRIFDLQDQIIALILATIEPELARAEIEQLKRQRPQDLDAWALYRQAMSVHSVMGWNEKAFAQTVDLLHQAIDRDPEFALAHAALALVLAVGHTIGFAASTDEARSQAEQALTLDGSDSRVLGFAGCALADIGVRDRAIGVLKRAIEGDPSNAQAWVALGSALLMQHKPEAAIATLEHGLRISPRDSRLAVWGCVYAGALGRVGRIDEAIEQARIACRRDDRMHISRVTLAVLLILTGREADARQALADARRIRPDLTHEDVERQAGRSAAKLLREIW